MHSCVYSMQMCLFYASGVPGELYYARNGYVNDYALSFNLPIKTEITEIYFDWFNDHPTYLPETKVTWWRWCMHNTHLYTHARAPTHLHNTHTHTNTYKEDLLEFVSPETILDKRSGIRNWCLLDNWLLIILCVCDLFFSLVYFDTHTYI